MQLLLRSKLLAVLAAELGWHWVVWSRREDIMRSAISRHLFVPLCHASGVGAAPRCSISQSVARSLGMAFVVLMPLLASVPRVALARPEVEFDLARAVECRDLTPRERLAQYPTQRIIDVVLPVSVRFHEVTRQDVDEISIEISGASAGLRVLDFAPQTQLASDITREIEVTTTTKKSKSLDGTLGGSLPIPGAEAAARVTPSISAGLSNCETATEKMNRLPPKHVVVVSGTADEGRGVFFKLMRTSQTSLEGTHELAVTFVAPRSWQGIPLQVKCSALGQRKILWVRQTAEFGESRRLVYAVPVATTPIQQTVFKPTDPREQAALGHVPTGEPQRTVIADGSVESPTRWRPSRGSAKASPAAEKREGKAVQAEAGQDQPVADRSQPEEASPADDKAEANEP